MFLFDVGTQVKKDELAGTHWTNPDGKWFVRENNRYYELNPGTGAKLTGKPASAKDTESLFRVNDENSAPWKLKVPSLEKKQPAKKEALPVQKPAKPVEVPKPAAAQKKEEKIEKTEPGGFITEQGKFYQEVSQQGVRFENLLKEKDAVQWTDSFFENAPEWLQNALKNDNKTNCLKFSNSVFVMMVGRGLNAAETTFGKLPEILKKNGLEPTLKNILVCMWNPDVDAINPITKKTLLDKEGKVIKGRSLLAEAMLGEEYDGMSVTLKGVNFWKDNFKVLVGKMEAESPKEDLTGKLNELLKEAGELLNDKYLEGFREYTALKAWTETYKGYVKEGNTVTKEDLGTLGDAITLYRNMVWDKLQGKIAEAEELFGNATDMKAATILSNAITNANLIEQTKVLPKDVSALDNAIKAYKEATKPEEKGAILSKADNIATIQKIALLSPKVKEREATLLEVFKSLKLVSYEDGAITLKKALDYTGGGKLFGRSSDLINAVQNEDYTEKQVSFFLTNSLMNSLRTIGVIEVKAEGRLTTKENEFNYPARLTEAAKNVLTDSEQEKVNAFLKAFNKEFDGKLCADLFKGNKGERPIDLLLKAAQGIKKVGKKEEQAPLADKKQVEAKKQQELEAQKVELERARKADEAKKQIELQQQQEKLAQEKAASEKMLLEGLSTRINAVGKENITSLEQRNTLEKEIKDLESAVQGTGDKKIIKAFEKAKEKANAKITAFDKVEEKKASDAQKALEQEQKLEAAKAAAAKKADEKKLAQQKLEEEKKAAEAQKALEQEQRQQEAKAAAEKLKAVGVRQLEAEAAVQVARLIELSDEFNKLKMSPIFNKTASVRNDKLKAKLDGALRKGEIIKATDVAELKIVADAYEAAIKKNSEKVNARAQAQQAQQVAPKDTTVKAQPPAEIIVPGDTITKEAPATAEAQEYSYKNELAGIKGVEWVHTMLGNKKDFNMVKEWCTQQKGVPLAEIEEFVNNLKNSTDMQSQCADQETAHTPEGLAQTIAASYKLKLIRERISR